MRILTMKEKDKATGKRLYFTLIKINPDKEGFNIFKTTNKIHRYIKKSPEESTEEAMKNL